jgi:hypothetical protein
MPTPAPTQITLPVEEELERTEGSKAYPHQFKKAQISNHSQPGRGSAGDPPPCKVGAARGRRPGARGVGGSQLQGETGCPERAAFHFCEM